MTAGWALLLQGASHYGFPCHWVFNKGDFGGSCRIKQDLRTQVQFPNKNHES
jgi:hypothetical protein